MTRGLRGHGAANVMKHLKRIHFPADKGAILDHAQRGPGPDTDDVLDLLRRITDKQYLSTIEIVQESAVCLKLKATGQQSSP